MTHMFSMKRLAAGLASALVLSAALTGSAAAEVKVTHAKGELTLPAVPAKVFVYDLASLDTLTALDVEVAGVPGGNKPGQLAKYADGKYQKIGSLFEPDFEAVAAAQPDLIIVGGRSAAKYEDLAKIAPTIDLSVDFNDFTGSALNNVKTLASLFGKTDKADELTAKYKASVEELKGKTAGAGKGLFVLTTGGKMATYGKGSRFGVIFGEYGLAQADDNIKIGLHGQPASFEYVLERNPDWLFVLDRDAAIGREGDAARQLLDNEIVRQTTAWQKEQVVYLNAANWYLIGGGITAMQDTVDQLNAAFSGK